MFDGNALGQFLKDRRATRQLSRSEVARRLGVARQSLIHWEIGQTQPSIDKLRDIVRAYELDAADRRDLCAILGVGEAELDVEEQAA